MADLPKTIKIHELPEISEINDSDIFIIEDNSKTYKITGKSLIDCIKNNDDINNYFVHQSIINNNNGIAPLDENKKVPVENLPVGTTSGTLFDGGRGKALEDSWDAHLLDTESHHTHENKSILDNITQDKIDKWDSGTGGESASSEEVNKIISGDIQVGNAKTLDGHEAEYFATQESLDVVQTSSSAELKTYGWYRVAELVGKSASHINGALANSPILSIKRNHQNNSNEQHMLLFEILSDDVCTITTLSSKSRTQLIKKARCTCDTTELKSYLEIYYTDGHASGNNTLFEITHGKTLSGAWKAIVPTLTEENVEGVTVTATYDIPANAKPATDLDLANYLPLTGGYITGEEAGIGSANSESGYTWGFRNSKRFITEQVLADGTYRIRDTNNAKNIINSTADGTTTVNATASGNLPLDGGGTVQRDYMAPIVLKNKTGSACFTGYYNVNGELGYIGVDGNEKPTFQKKDGTKTELLHTGNMTLPASTSYETNQIRNTVFTTTDPGANATTSYANGSLICVYE